MTCCPSQPPRRMRLPHSLAEMRPADGDLAKASGRVLIFPGTRAGFERGFAELRHALDAHSLAQRVRYYGELVFEEVVTNIIKYAYTDDREHNIAVWLDVRRDAIVLTFEDDGLAFNPLDGPVADAPPAQRKDAVGGRGLLLVRTAA